VWAKGREGYRGKIRLDKKDRAVHYTVNKGFV
jgi:hypothetical protein